MSKIVEKVRAFIQEMLEWEIEFHTQKRTDAYKDDSEFRKQADDQARLRLARIFETYLSNGALKKIARARMDTLGTGQPPEYDQTVDDQSEVSTEKGGSVEAVSRKGLKQRYRYSVIFENDVAKIDEIHVWRGSSNKWERRNSI